MSNRENTDIGLEILEGLKEVKRHKHGKVKLKTSSLSEPSPAQDIR